MAINRIKTGGITDNTIQSGDIAPGTVANDRLANNTITINGTSIALGASGDIVAGTDWQAVTVADGSTQLSAEAGKGYFLDTNAGVIEVFLPTSPSRGDTIILADYAGTWGTNKVLVNTGGALVDSTQGGGGDFGNEFSLSTNNSVVELVYVDAAKGWLTKENEAKTALSAAAGYTPPAYVAATGGTVTTSGDFKIHTFTGDGCFVVSCGGNPAGNDIVDYLVVAGGGGGGGATCSSRSGAGGGAGGFRESHSTPVSGCYSASPLATPTGITVSATTYPVTVGAGGSPGPLSAKGTNGSNSVFSTITSAGGGAGGARGGCQTGSNGGSGGGAIDNNTIGLGNTPPVSPPQGQNGATPPSGSPNCGSGGGGGAGATGSAGSVRTGGNGGNGVTTSINATPTAYAGGGGAGGGGNLPLGPTGTGGSGGTGGGGDGGPTGAVGTAGSANTGGAGGGSGANPGNAGGAGGKGIVIIRYKFQ